MKRKLFLMPTLLVATTPIIGVVGCSKRIDIELYDADSERALLPYLISEPFDIELETIYKIKIDISKCVSPKLDYHDNAFFKVVKANDGERIAGEYEVLKYTCDGRKLAFSKQETEEKDKYWIQTSTSWEGINVKAIYKEALKQNSYLEVQLRFKELEPSGKVQFIYVNSF